MDMDSLRDAIPAMAKELGQIMIDDALKVFSETGLTLDQASPSVSVTYSHDSEDRRVKVTLSIKLVDEDEDDEE